MRDSLDRRLFNPLAIARALAALALAFSLGALTGCSSSTDVASSDAGASAPSTSASSNDQEGFDLSKVPSYTGSPYTVVNDNVPSFAEEDALGPSEYYPDLDSLGRCGACQAVVGTDTMPTEPRGSIGMVKPSGWHTVRYDDLIDDKYLYNRCHLIGYQLTGENANEKNLITGTRYMNVDGMLPFENEVADYVESTGNHVLYRVTPIFVDNELVARGVHMEALSVEDNGAGVAFNVFCYNAQPGIAIDYATGESWRDDAAVDGDAVALAEQEAAASPSTDAGAAAAAASTSTDTSADAANDNAEVTYILNVRSGKFHYPDCSYVDEMSPKNKREFTGSRQEAIDHGYTPCKWCNP